MKYKLITKYPSLPNDWEEGMTISQGDIRPRDFAPTNGKYFQAYLLPREVEDQAKFWAPYLFTTNDCVDIYKGDEYWLVNSIGNIIKMYPTMGWEMGYEDGAILQEQKTFSTREAAQAYLDSLKPKFEVGDWVYVESSSGWKALIKVDHWDRSDIITNESYSVFPNGGVSTEGYGTWGTNYAPTYIKYTKATKEQILDILSRVAIDKGFVVGAEFKSPWSSEKLFKIEENNFTWNTYQGDGLYQENYAGCIYSDTKSQWAEIIEEKEVKEGDLVITSIGKYIYIGEFKSYGKDFVTLSSYKSLDIEGGTVNYLTGTFEKLVRLATPEEIDQYHNHTYSVTLPEGCTEIKITYKTK